jgi:hypothetical protein
VGGLYQVIHGLYERDFLLFVVAYRVERWARRFDGQMRLPKQDLGLPKRVVVVATSRGEGFRVLLSPRLGRFPFRGPVHVSRGPWHGLAAPTQRRQAPLTLSSWALSYKRRRVVDNSAVY